MEAMRNSWTDDRLDDLNLKVDRGFAQVERRFEQVDKRFEQIDARFAKVDERFEKVEAEFTAVRLEMKEGFESLMRVMIHGIIALVAAILAGFGGIIVLVATQV